MSRPLRPEFSQSASPTQASLQFGGSPADWSRRRWMAATAAAMPALGWLPTVTANESNDFAESLATTARLTEGPFYPDRLPLDTDNDLIIVNDTITPAVGKILHLTGRVRLANGKPLRNVTVEIWQADAGGVYLHSGSARGDQRDDHFQGFGRFLTDSSGRYYFRTIEPVRYGSRTPHIHFAINRGDRRLLTTQMLIQGHPDNARDGVLRSVKDPRARETLMSQIKPIPDSTIGELSAEFDLVLNVTAAEGDDGILRG